MENICLPVLSRFAGFAGALDRRAMEATAAATSRGCMSGRPAHSHRLRQLSGGNQQKVLFAKWLETKPRVFVMDEPTIGIDVGSKAEIRGIIDEIAATGVGIVLVTTELEELVVAVRPRAGDVSRRDRRRTDRAAIEREAHPACLGLRREMAVPA